MIKKIDSQRLVSKFLIAVGHVIPAANKLGYEREAKRTFNSAKSDGEFRSKVGLILLFKRLEAAGYDCKNSDTYQKVLGVEDRKAACAKFGLLEDGMTKLPELNNG